MKKPKEVKRHCPFCKKHTAHKISQSKKKTPFTVHPMSHGGGVRQKAKHRGKGIGKGNAGRYSRRPIGKFKMTGKKMSKKTDLRYECKECKKVHVQKSGLRAKKVEFV